MNHTAPSALVPQLAAVSRFAAPGIAVAVACGSIPAIIAYPGSTGWAVLYCVVSGGLLPLAALSTHSPFRALTALFLGLGFWAKFVAHFAIGAQFIEPIGDFSGTPAAWDEALATASAGLAGVVVAFVALSRVKPVPRPRPASGSDRISGLGIALLAISSVAAVALFVFNHAYAILRIGLVPILDLHPYLYVLVAFAVSWGILLWLLGLAWWLVERQRLAPAALIYVAVIEGALAALSMGSRVQMILHVAAGLFALWWGVRWRQWRISFPGGLKAVIVMGALFVGTLLLVSVNRAISYAGSAAAPETEAASRLRAIPHEISTLFIMRWIGLDGVLATVEGRDRVDMSLLYRALAEPPSAGVDAIYQRMAGTGYQRSDHFVFMTIPGPVAVAAFSGSALVCFLAMAGLVLAGSAIEYCAGRATGNPAATAVSGVALAYLLVQVNFPRTLLFFVVELVAAITVMAVIGWLGTKPRATPRA